MSGGFPIGRILGIPIYLHASWFVVFLLVTFSLLAQPAPAGADWSATAELAGAVATSLLFFASILLHELGHSVVAVRRGVRVRSITLFILGGVAMMEREPETPRAELEIAIAGPIVSAALALLFTLVARFLPAVSPAGSVASWLATINLAVAVFNLLPGFPLDGGRVLRAFLWARSGDPAQATRSAARAGRGIAWAIIAFGGLELLLGHTAGGLWLAFIGWFLLLVSGATLRQAQLGPALRGLVARDVMSPELPVIDARATVAEFAREIASRGRHWAVVRDGGDAAGIVTLSDLARAAYDGWDRTPVAAVSTPIHRVVTARPDLPVQELLASLGGAGVRQIPVIDGGRILGAVTRETLARVLELRSSPGGGAA